MADAVGRQFDPELVEIFFSCLEFIHFIQQRYPENHGETGQAEATISPE
jgi:response regulator RpfG family c-di-GMP phosphodiesterase